MEGINKYHDTVLKYIYSRMRYRECADTKYANIMLDLAFPKLEPWAKDLEAMNPQTQEDLDSFDWDIEEEVEDLVASIEAKFQTSEDNLEDMSDESLSLITNINGEKPGDDIWPKNKSDFNSKAPEQLKKLADFYGIGKTPNTRDLSDDQVKNLLGEIIGIC
ncbi:unnamed protein product [Cyberlindnera jadinii]|uniref:Uncharacterized protein n=1 Tax=Cyberlindnera jadinii (strain ATCC 18201 / CBS 1600 / BCRC 20928 / JCM 3617 / NBRC 0987 / NRRL Y-1542) TaxID=983966 RepID=A0A0H5C4Q2_CYBJN|nr:hypothetical protein CYBJADRAFT_172524 [Cyberlindnera jadinii NRRL Y-1542]ODV74552.1 hypothetical protein CYBJADRAFT_172524 [Cyberlindnera jadinii NRRL Y-1542]CEP22976.1 unnamed protein product [Cyberlindnera jadinii]